MSDAVDHPRHYNNHPSGVECIELNRQFAGSLAAAIKYAFRLGQKDDPIQDAEKCLWYLADANASAPHWQDHLARFATEPAVRVWIDKVMDAEPPGSLLYELLLGFANNRSLFYSRSKCLVVVNYMKSRIGAGR